jgi:murein DD-endopeptidase MepM/ murein hydrolase activator NlpD
MAKNRPCPEGKVFIIDDCYDINSDMYKMAVEYSDLSKTMNSVGVFTQEGKNQAYKDFWKKWTGQNFSVADKLRQYEMTAAKGAALFNNLNQTQPVKVDPKQEAERQQMYQRQGDIRTNNNLKNQNQIIAQTQNKNTNQTTNTKPTIITQAKPKTQYDENRRYELNKAAALRDNLWFNTTTGNISSNEQTGSGWTKPGGTAFEQTMGTFSGVKDPTSTRVIGSTAGEAFKDPELWLAALTMGMGATLRLPKLINTISTGLRTSIPGTTRLIQGANAIRVPTSTALRFNLPTSGITYGDALGLTFGLNSAYNLSNPNSLTRTSLTEAYNNPTVSNILGATGNVAMDGLGIFGSPGVIPAIGAGVNFTRNASRYLTRPFKINTSLFSTPINNSSRLGIASSTNNPFAKSANLTDDQINEVNTVGEQMDNFVTSRVAQMRTPEGRRRIQQYIDDNPQIVGNKTIDDIISEVEDAESLNKIYYEAVRTDLPDIVNRIDALRAEYNAGKISKDVYQNNMKLLTDEESLLRQSIDEFENMMKEGVAYNAGPFNYISPNYLKTDDVATVAEHEILGHGSHQRWGKQKTALDQRLESLELLDEPYLLPSSVTNGSTPVDKRNALFNFISSSGDYFKQSKNYFKRGSKSLEKLPHALEVRQQLLKEGRIKNIYDPIPENMLVEHYNNYMNIPQGVKYPLRIYDIMKNSSSNFKLLSEVLNNAHSIVPTAIGVGTGTYLLNNSNSNTSSQQRKGGLIKANLGLNFSTTFTTTASTLINTTPPPPESLEVKTNPESGFQTWGDYTYLPDQGWTKNLDDVIVTSTRPKQQASWLNKLVAENVYPYGGFGHSESEYKIDNFIQRDLNQQLRDGKLTFEEYKEKIAQNSYNKKGKKLSETWNRKMSMPTVDPSNLNASYDALYMHQGLPQKYNSFIKSQYKPTNSKNPNTIYYSLSPSLEKEIIEDLTSYQNKDFINSSEKERKVKGSLVAQGSLKNFKYSKGKDEKGDYISYYDINNYDNPLDWIGNSFEIYGRIYLDPKTGKPYLPKHAKGGDISIPDLEEGNWLDRYDDGGQLQQFRPGGYFATTFTTTLPLSESDAQIFSQTKDEISNWYKGRANNPDTRISGEAKQVLEKLNVLPDISTSNVNYVPFTKLYRTGAAAMFFPSSRNITLTNPYTSFDQQLQETKPGYFGLLNRNNLEYVNKNTPFSKNYKEDLTHFYNQSRLSYPRKHEAQHYWTEDAIDIVDKYKKDIANKYISLPKYVDMVYDRDAPKDLSGGDQMNYKSFIANAYRNTTGLQSYSGDRGVNRSAISNMRNEEMYRTLMDLRTTFGLDPSRNSTSDEFREIYQKVNDLYNKSKESGNEGERIRYRHMIDLFDSYGDDFEKINEINNLLVRRNPTTTRFAKLGGNISTSPISSSVTITTTLGMWDAFTSTVSDWFGSLFDDEEEKPPAKPKVPPKTVYQQMLDLYNNKSLDFKNQYNTNNTNFITKNPTYINLTSGRFNTASVPNYVIDAVIAAAKRQNYPVGKVLALMGRESTFGTGAKVNIARAGKLGDLMSAWNPANELGYEPYALTRFFADNKVPGVVTNKSKHGWNYSINDQAGLENYVNSHPELLKKYTNIINSTKTLGNLTPIDLAIMKLVKSGVKGYNPGDKLYEQMYNQDYQLLKADPALQLYLKQKGATFKYGGKIVPKNFFKPRNSSIFATGGLTFKQAYDFLFDGEDNARSVAVNSAPSESEVDDLRAQNESLLRTNRRLNREMSLSRNRNLAFNVVNTQSYNKPSENTEEGTGDPTNGTGLLGTTPNTKYGSTWSMQGNVPEFTTGSDGRLTVVDKNEKKNNNPSTTAAGEFGAFFAPDVKYRISSEFGPRKAPKKGASTNHRAIDIATDPNTPVFSPSGGVVTRVSTDSGLGNRVEVELDNGATIRLGHLNHQDVKVGQRVERGHQLGRVGSTGISTGPHLHLELIEKGERINPRKYFKF